MKKNIIRITDDTCYQPPAIAVPIASSLRRRVLVPVLVLALLQVLAALVKLLAGLGVLPELLEQRPVVEEGLVGDGEAALDGRAGLAAREPGLDVREHLNVDAREDAHGGPAEQADVRDGEAAAPRAGDEVALAQPLVQDAVQALGLAHVALSAVGVGLLGELEHVIGLALHGTKAAVLPAHPLLADRVVVAVDGKAQLVLRVVVARQVRQDGDAFEDGKVAAVVVHNGRDAAVGAQGREPGLLLCVFHDVNGLPGVLKAVRLFELLEQDGCLVTIRRACSTISKDIQTRPHLSSRPSAFAGIKGRAAKTGCLRKAFTCN